MNPLSALALITVGVIIALTYHHGAPERSNRQNRMVSAVMLCLAWWCFCDAFFFMAPDKEAAFLWHRLGALGWCGFIAPATAYYARLTSADKHIPRWFKIAYWIFATLFTLRFMLAMPTPYAVDMVESGAGLGWSYVHGTTIWSVLYVIYAGASFGGAMYCMKKWRDSVKMPSASRLTSGFMSLNLVSLAIGTTSIYILPRFTSYLPPLGCVAVLVFAVGYWTRLRGLDFSSFAQPTETWNVFESCHSAMLVMDEDFNALYLNREARRILNVTDPRDCKAKFDAEAARRFRVFAASDRMITSGYPVRMENGAYLISAVSRLRLRRNLDVFVLCLNDVTEIHQAQSRLAYLAYSDELTGLMNRRGLADELEAWSEAYAKDGVDFEMLFMDLARFKHINDHYGHNTGDAVLAVVSDVIQAQLATGDVFARYAGDEFVILHRGGDGEALSKCIREAVAKIDFSRIVDGLKLEVDVGVARYSEAKSVNGLFYLADNRMYSEKQQRREPEDGEAEREA